MSNAFDAAVTLTIEVLAVWFLVASIARGCVWRLRYVNLWVAAMLFCDGLRFLTYWQFGFQSKQYFTVFYLTDAVLVAATYLLIISFFDVIFGDTPMRSQVRWALGFVVVLVGIISWAMIAAHSQSPHFRSRLMVEFLQNMYFAAVLLTVLVWISLLHLRVEDRQMAMLIAGLGLAFSVQAGAYAMQSLMPKELFLSMGFVMRRVPAIATLLKVGIWCYAMTMVPVAVREAQAARQLDPAMARVPAQGSA